MADPIVICVDDDPEILASVARCLRRLPISIRTTELPAEVLVWVARERIAVLVSDYDMPVMNGAQLAAQVKNIRPETVRIMLTGQRTFETVVDGINQGEVFRFIAKPFEPEALRAAVTEALARHEELVTLTGDRDRRVRRDALNLALEQEHPGITHVALTDGIYRIDESILALGAALGLTY